MALLAVVRLMTALLAFDDNTACGKERSTTVLLGTLQPQCHPPQPTTALLPVDDG
jgi:hypothetical protein